MKKFSLMTAVLVAGLTLGMTACGKGKKAQAPGGAGGGQKSGSGGGDGSQTAPAWAPEGFSLGGSNYNVESNILLLKDGKVSVSSTPTITVGESALLSISVTKVDATAKTQTSTADAATLKVTGSCIDAANQDANTNKTELTLISTASQVAGSDMIGQFVITNNAEGATSKGFSAAKAGACTISITPMKADGKALATIKSKDDQGNDVETDASVTIAIAVNAAAAGGSN